MTSIVTGLSRRQETIAPSQSERFLEIDSGFCGLSAIPYKSGLLGHSY